MIEEACAAHIAGLAGVQAVFGDGVDPRVVVDVLPTPPDWPAVVVQRISGAPLYNVAGESGLHRARLQLDILAVGPGGGAQVAALRAAIGPAVSAFSGSWGTTVISSCFIDSERSTPSPGEPHRWAISIDVLVLYRPS